VGLIGCYIGVNTSAYCMLGAPLPMSKDWFGVGISSGQKAHAYAHDDMSRRPRVQVPRVPVCSGVSTESLDSWCTTAPWYIRISVRGRPRSWPRDDSTLRMTADCTPLSWQELLIYHWSMAARSQGSTCQCGGLLFRQTMRASPGI
jgi:hypothetical protein